MSIEFLTLLAYYFEPSIDIHKPGIIFVTNWLAISLADGVISGLFRPSGSGVREEGAWKILRLIPLTLLIGCQVDGIRRSGPILLLGAAGLDRITVGAAAASIDMATDALPPRGQTVISTNTLAISGVNLFTSPPLLGDLISNSSTTQGTASAISGQLAQTSGSSHTSVSSANGGTAIDAAGASFAAGPAMGQAQLSFRFQGYSTARADLAFGTAIASACCAPSLQAQVVAQGEAGGPYSMELQGRPVSDIPGQVQSRVDIAVASSVFPIIDPGQMMSLVTPRGSPLY